MKFLLISYSIIPSIVVKKIISLSIAIDFTLNPPKILASTALDHCLVLKLNEIIPDWFAAYRFLLVISKSVKDAFLIGGKKSSVLYPKSL